MKIPKQEKQVLNYVNDGEITHTVTRNIIGKYILYKKIGDNEYQKLKTSDNPKDFDMALIY